MSGWFDRFKAGQETAMIVDSVDQKVLKEQYEKAMKRANEHAMDRVLISGRREGKSITTSKIMEEIEKYQYKDTVGTGGLPDPGPASTAAKSVSDFRENFEVIKAQLEEAEKKAKPVVWTLTNIDDDLATGKEVAMATRYTKKQVGDALDPFVEELDKAMDTWDGEFMLAEPRKVTQKNDDGFKKLPLLGGEQFEGIGCYRGKRDGVIFIFESAGVTGTIEVNGADALDTITGFGKFIRETLGFDLEDNLDDLVKKASEKKREKEIEEAREVYSAEFGAW